MKDGGERGSVLFVCRANICRSPLMEFGFQSDLSERQRITAGSAGTFVHQQQGICGVSADLISGLRGGEDFVGQHQPLALTATRLERQDLVITATREERAEAARLLPSARGSLFTLAEAIMLGRMAFDDAELERVKDVEEAELVAAYAYLLDARRGTIELPVRRRLFRRALSAEEQLDIPDFHHRRKGAHLSGVNGVMRAVTEFALQVTRGIESIERVGSR